MAMSSARKTASPAHEPSHTLVFMGVGPEETFRCRIYSGEPREPLTEEQARAWLLADAAKYGDEGTHAPRGEAWDALVDKMCEEGAIELRAGLVYLAK